MLALPDTGCRDHSHASDGATYTKLEEAKRRWDLHQVFNHALSVDPVSRFV
jgi:hypothetical protein